ncbi:MAG: glycoside hydrolase family 10 protein [Xenococcaceae cyanobacterium]
MLGTGLSFEQGRSRLNILGKWNKIIFSLVSLSLTLYASPAMAKLGVVRSQENARQWPEITNRLQATGLDYCILDSSNWQQESDLKNVRVLFLPNVETLNGAQAIALDRWMSQGGRVIVTGPTGSLSQPQVRSKLRSLFGASWGFPISSPSTLQIEQQEWVWHQKLSATLIGGAVIPAGLNSQTAAVWLAEGTPPAVVVTDNSTFLGWRWGVDAVAPAALDTAWLQASISRYGLSRLSQATGGSYNPSLCNPKLPSTDETDPLLPNWQKQSLELSVAPKGGKAIPRHQIYDMSQELKGLIHRFESSLLAADATNSGVDLPTEKAIEQFLNSRELGKRPNQDNGSGLRHSNSSAHRAVIQAREGLQKFLQLVKRGEYNKARLEWVQARRTLWYNYPIQRQRAQPEIRAIWLDRGTIVQAKSESDLAGIFDRLAAAGINTVFFETVNASYPIYPSRVAPEQNPLVKGWDPLKAAIKLARERGMELHAWVWIFAAANQRHNIILNQPTDYLGPVLSTRPDWGITDRQGRFFHHNSKKVFFDPANPEVQRYLLSLLEEIATRYEVDGIHLDYIRYPFQSANVNKTYGYSRVSRQLFKEMTGVDPIKISLSHPLWSQWIGFRIRQVDSFVASASQMLRKKHPDLTLSAAVFPIRRRERLLQLQQNWEEWAQEELIDLLVPMTYALDTYELQEMTQPLFSQSIRGSILVLPGIRLLNVPDIVAVDQMQLLRDLPAGGYALFAAENLNPNLQRIFSRTQGSVELTQREPLPHRQPFQATAIRYQALQREWSFLLANHQLWMEEQLMKDWGKEADYLAADLNRLADEPSMRHLLSAQVTLSSFRRRFSNWMQQHRKVQPYQVRVWENRLEALERLLNYGERVVLNSDRAKMAER